MKREILFLSALLAVSAVIFTMCKKNQPRFCDGSDTIVTTTKVFATGLNNPRGLKFGPDGSLYVAEGGVGGTNSTVGSCTQVIADVGPYTGSKTGSRISKIASDGTRTTVVDNLPSSQTSPMLGSLISGV